MPVPEITPHPSQPQKTIPDQIASPHPAVEKQNKILILSIGVILIIALTIAGIFLYLKESQKTDIPSATDTSNQSAFVSGSVGINGVIPQGATIAIGQRRHGTEEFAIALKNLPAVDGVSYHWIGATHGEPYDLQAYVQVGANTIAQSEIVTLVAPADSEELHINIPSNITPTPLESGEIQPSYISGIVDLNGYIPPGATIAIVQQASGQTGYTTAVSGINASDGVAWSWNNAAAGSSYAIKAYLQVGGNTVSQSNAISVTAPAANEVLVINSTATPSSPATVSVTGAINLNGSVPQGSTISVAMRPTGTQNFNIFVSNLPASNGITWTFPQATSGQSYDFQAYLQSNGQSSSVSQILTATAPANNEILTINAQTQPSPAPSNSISSQCMGKNPVSNLWQVSLNVNKGNVISNAQQYWVTIGSSQGGSDVYSYIVNANNTGQSQSVQTGYSLNDGQQYYAQYAYSTCQSCNTFSQFTPSIQVMCATQNTPTPTNTPSPTLSPTPTSSPLPTPTSTIVPTNTPSPTVLLQ